MSAADVSSASAASTSAFLMISSLASLNTVPCDRMVREPMEAAPISAGPSGSPERHSIRAGSMPSQRPTSSGKTVS
jgi:hypothetical protein